MLLQQALLKAQDGQMEDTQGLVRVVRTTILAAEEELLKFVPLVAQILLPHL